MTIEDMLEQLSEERAESYFDKPEHIYTYYSDVILALYRLRRELKSCQKG